MKVYTVYVVDWEDILEGCPDILEAFNMWELPAKYEGIELGLMRVDEFYDEFETHIREYHRQWLEEEEWETVKKRLDELVDREETVYVNLAS